MAYELEAAKRRPLVDRSIGRRLKTDHESWRIPRRHSREHNSLLKQAIDKHGRPREVLTDRGSQFYANEGERREKGISQF
jgi:hypothetical protein